jgi:hypothetical protein
MPARPETESVPLLRGGALVSSLVGSFGGALRETRLTAMLGYAISLAPEQFMDLFNVRGKVMGVTLEANHDQDRSDILIETSLGKAIVEAKCDPTDPVTQAFKYRSKWRALLTDYVPTGNQAKLRGVKYVSWKRIAEVLASTSRGSNQSLRFICSDLIRYLEEHNMVRRKDSVEIYAREINEEVTLNFFLKARMYGCWYQASSRLPEALYFAPHFGRAIADAHPGVKQGISYIARIETVEVVETWKELLAVTKSVRGKTWLNSHIDHLEAIHRKWSWSKPDKRSFLFLGEPRLVFNPPVRKDNLQKGKGRLSKRTFSFDELFVGWSK